MSWNRKAGSKPQVVCRWPPHRHTHTCQAINNNDHLLKVYYYTCSNLLYTIFFLVITAQTAFKVANQATYKSVHVQLVKNTDKTCTCKKLICIVYEIQGWGYSKLVVTDESEDFFSFANKKKYFNDSIIKLFPENYCHVINL